MSASIASESLIATETTPLNSAFKLEAEEKITLSTTNDPQLLEVRREVESDEPRIDTENSLTSNSPGSNVPGSSMKLSIGLPPTIMEEQEKEDGSVEDKLSDVTSPPVVIASGGGEKM